MVIVIDFAAAEALFAAIRGHSVRADWIEAVKRLGQVAGDGFEFLERIAGKEIRMAEASAREGTLQELHALAGGGEIFEGHVRLRWGISGREANQKLHGRRA